ncbi:MAG: hypothetical protein ABFD16_02210 [Thermoguttaceae bacterium]
MSGWVTIGLVALVLEARKADGRTVTAYYSKNAPEYADYHMGTVVWSAPAR